MSIRAVMAPALAAVTLLLLIGSGQVHGRAAARTVIELQSGWRFQFGEAAEDVIGAQFDDRAWQAVSIPHTWNRLGEFGTERTAATNNQRGVGWYRLQFDVPAGDRDQRYFLQFDAVGTLADVWLNGKKIGSHAGAFSRFRFDVTDSIRRGAANLLVVKADNSKPEPGSSTQDVIPIGGDFFVHGGLYRGVSLITTSAVHVDLLDYGGPGVYAQANQITSERADIGVLVRLRNDTGKSRKISALTRLVAADGREVASATQVLRIGPRSNAELRANLVVPQPRLWNGRADPYLYEVQVELRDGSAVLDALTQPLGIRSLRVDPNDGFFLNGKHISLRGVSRHQDRFGKGWALTKADHEEDMALIAELGANAVRFAHYQHAQEWFELADRYGMLVWSEVPFVNAANFTPEEPTPALVANARQQLMEQIRQNFNHPSVFTWSVGNEVNIGNFTGHRKATKSLGLLRNLHELAKQEDPARLTVFADCCEFPPLRVPEPEPLAGTTDLIGYNRYYGWYYGEPSGLGKVLDTFHERHARLPIGVSEYGAGGATSQHTDNPHGGVLQMVGRPHPEEIQSAYHEQWWPQIRSRRFVWGSFIWNMFDFSSDLREEGDVIDINDKGLITYDRKIKKDAFFYYKAQWSEEPVVHITSGRYTQRPYAVTDVRVYSNAPSVRLLHEEKDLGTATCADRICVWRDVRLHPGANTLTAHADIAGKTASHSVQWNAPDASKGLLIDVGDLVGHRTAEGQLAAPDHFFSGGEPRLLNGLAPGGFSTPGEEPVRRAVADANGPALYEDYRVGSFSYDIPLPNGAWTVTVHSFERDAALAGRRTFNIIANDRMQMQRWSPAKTAGGVLKRADASFNVRVSDGRLRLQFVPVGGPALVAAITIAPQ